MDPLQFQKAEFVDSRQKCAVCPSFIESSYYHLAGKTICPSCAEKAEAAQQPPKSGSVMRGLVYGAGAAAACSAGYAIITLATGMEFAITAIVVGYIVGRAVRTGSHRLGGRRLQILAVILTYLAITTSYIPVVIKQAAGRQKQEKANSAAASALPANAPASPVLDPNARRVTAGRAALGVLLIAGICMVSPLLGLADGISGILGVIIIFVGLVQAWRQTGRDPRLLTGPYSLTGQNAVG